MAQREDGWPLGLQPLNLRVGLVRRRGFSGSISFNTLLAGSQSSTSDSSSDLDTESTGSFFHEKSITLGSLIGVSNILELSGRSIRGRNVESLRCKKSTKSKTRFFSLCTTKGGVDIENSITPPSLGQFVEVERKIANDNRRNDNPVMFEFTEAQEDIQEPNSLFIDGQIAPPHSSPWLDSDTGRRSNGTVNGGQILLSWICGYHTN